MNLKKSGDTKLFGRKEQKKLHFKLISLILLINILIILSSLTTTSDPILVEDAYPPSQDPNIVIEFEESEVQIDTSPEITEPMVLVAGTVTLEGGLPYVSVNLTVESTNWWNCSVQDNTFDLTLVPAELSNESIVVTIIAPLGVINGSEEKVTVSGTWSYIPENPLLDPQGGALPEEDIKVIALNTTTAEDGNGDGDDNGKDKDDEPSFLAGFEGFFIVTVIASIIIFSKYRNRK